VKCRRKSAADAALSSAAKLAPLSQGASVQTTSSPAAAAAAAAASISSNHQASSVSSLADDTLSTSDLLRVMAEINFIYGEVI